MSLASTSRSKKSSFWTPGRQNSVSTPSRRRASMTRSATVHAGRSGMGAIVERGATVRADVASRPSPRPRTRAARRSGARRRWPTRSRGTGGRLRPPGIRPPRPPGRSAPAPWLRSRTYSSSRRASRPPASSDQPHVTTAYPPSPPPSSASTQTWPSPSSARRGRSAEPTRAAANSCPSMAQNSATNGRSASRSAGSARRTNATRPPYRRGRGDGGRGRGRRRCPAGVRRPAANGWRRHVSRARTVGGGAVTTAAG